MLEKAGSPQLEKALSLYLEKAWLLCAKPLPSLYKDGEHNVIKGGK